MDWSEIKSEKLIFLNLIRYGIYQAIIKYWAKTAF